MGHKVDQPFDRQQGAEKGDNKPHREEGQILLSQAVPGFIDVVAGGQKHGGNGEEKGKFGGGPARQAKEHAANDGRTGTGSAGDERKNLCQPKFEGVAPFHLINVGDARSALPPLHQEDDQPADD